MTWWQSIILGVVQGLTEFLPVSSSGHLVVAQELVGIEVHDLAFDVVAHTGTLLAVITVFRKDLVRILVDVLHDPIGKKGRAGSKLFWLVGVATIPAVVAGVALQDAFASFFDNLAMVGVFFCVTGAVLFVAGRCSKRGGSGGDAWAGASSLTFRRALVVGIAQACAIAPGISRSGSTIAASLIVGVKRETAVLFSFLLAIPVILGAAVLELGDIVWTADRAVSLGIGFVTAYLAGLVGLLLLMRAVRSCHLGLFSYYLFPVGILTIIAGLVL